jgi:hypothetical protein
MKRDQAGYRRISRDLFLHTLSAPWPYFQAFSFCSGEAHTSAAKKAGWIITGRGYNLTDFGFKLGAKGSSHSQDPQSYWRVGSDLVLTRKP